MTAGLPPPDVGVGGDFGGLGCRLPDLAWGSCGDVCGRRVRERLLGAVTGRRGRVLPDHRILLNPLHFEFRQDIPELSPFEVVRASLFGFGRRICERRNAGAREWDG